MMHTTIVSHHYIIYTDVKNSVLALMLESSKMKICIFYYRSAKQVFNSRELF